MADPFRHYLLLARMWMRAAWQYRTSVVLLTIGQFVANGLDIVAILIVFTSIPRLAGFDLADVAFLYGTSYTAFAVSDMLFGSMDRLSFHLRDGTLDVMMIRPISLLVQVATDAFSPRRLGNLAQGVTVLTVALASVNVQWTAGRIVMLPVMLVTGVVMFAAIWTATAAFQFVVPQAHEAANALTYGGNYTTQYPLAIYGRHAMQLLTFVVPLAFLNWQPALYVLDKPDPLGLPGPVRFASPLVATVLVVVAAVAWRAGVRSYRGTGS